MENELLDAIKDVRTDIKADNAKTKTELQARYDDVKTLLEQRDAAFDSLKAQMEEMKTEKEERAKQLLDLQDSMDEMSRYADSMKANGSNKPNFEARFKESFQEESFQNKVKQLRDKEISGTGFKLDLRDISFENPTNHPLGSMGVILPSLRPSPSLLRQYIPTQSTTDTAITIYKHIRNDGGAEMVPRGGLKPKLDPVLEISRENVRKIAVTEKIDEELLEDINGFQDFITNLLTIDLQRKENQQIIGGDGVGQNLTGLQSQAGTLNLVGTGIEGSMVNPSEMDVILAAITTLEDDQMIPDVIMINPYSHFAMMVARTSDNAYLNVDQRSGAMSIGGVRLIKNSDIPRGTFLVGDLQASTRLYDKKTLEVNVFNQNEDDALHNRILVVVEERLLLAVTRNYGMVRGTFADGIQQLKQA